MKTREEDAAFGCVGMLSREEDVYNHGLTKRELFAAMAMQGLLATETDDYHYETTQNLAKVAVEHADALIEELNKE